MSKKIFRVLAGVVVGLFLSGCSEFDVLNLVGSDRDYILEQTISYGEDPRQTIDILLPTTPAPAAVRPVVVFYYGGGWKAGSRRDYRFAAAALAKLGYVAVIPDYRLYPAVKFPDSQSDAARALRWTQDNIYRYGGDPAKIFLMGHSAGAQMAALLALDRESAKAAGIASYTIKGVIGLAGPYAMAPSQVESVRDVFAGVPDEDTVRPVKFVSDQAPPMLLLYGLDDKTVGRVNAQELAKLLRAEGRDVTLIEYPDVGHPGIALAMSPLFRSRAPVLTDTKAFIDRLASS